MSNLNGLFDGFNRLMQEFETQAHRISGVPKGRLGQQETPPVSPPTAEEYRVWDKQLNQWVDDKVRRFNASPQDVFFEANVRFKPMQRYCASQQPDAPQLYYRRFLRPGQPSVSAPEFSGQQTKMMIEDRSEMNGFDEVYRYEFTDAQQHVYVVRADSVLVEWLLAPSL